MKTVFIALISLLPLSSFAATGFSCHSTSSEGRDLLISFHSEAGILLADSTAHIIAKGMVTTEFEAKTQLVGISDDGKVKIVIVTLNSAGQVDEDSIEAVLELPISDGYYATLVIGEGTLKLTKKPSRFRSRIKFLDEYQLSNCQGQF